MHSGWSLARISMKEMVKVLIGISGGHTADCTRLFPSTIFSRQPPQEGMTVHSVLTSNKKNIILSRDIVSTVREGS